MKNKTMILSRIAVFSGLLLLFSCKKDYTCQCTQIVTVPAYTNGGQNYPQQVTVNSITNTFKSKKKDSESGCKQGESIRSYPSPYAAQGQGATVEIVTCELK
jgi:hypothetical protein